MKSLRSINLPNWSMLLALFALSLFSYGLLAPFLGFYWDDWPTMWYLHTWGPGIFREVFASDRPLLGRLFMLTTSLLGESMLGWQVFGLLTRWLSSLAFWLALRQIWPRHPRPVAWTALLFAVYPGFSQQFIAVTYSHVFILLTAFLLSFAAMGYALRHPPRFWSFYLVSLALSAFSLFSVEYFFGLELIRPLVIWLVLGDSTRTPRERLKRTLVIWAPYLLLMGVFLVWRFVLTTTPRARVNVLGHIQSSPLQTALDLARTIAQDLFQSSLLAWVQALDLRSLAGFGRAATLLYVLVSGLVAGISCLYLYLFRPGDPTAPTQSRQWGRQAAALGLVALLVGGWPIWATNLRIELDFPWDRFTLAMMPGASLLLVGLLEWIIRPLWPRLIVVSLAIGLAVGLQFRHANEYRREWNMQKAFFWQLAWRAPALQPGTLLLTSELPFTHFTDNSLTAPLNWQYAPGKTSRQMDYLLYDIDTRLELGLPDLEPGEDIDQPYRSSSFRGSTDRAIVLYYLPPGCVKVLDSRRDAQTPQKPKYLSDAMRLSNLSRILPSPPEAARPPLPLFGAEPAHDWCYDFEKAELALQSGDWQEVARLGDHALSLSERLYEVNAPELLPYIEGYAHTGDWESAEKLTQEAQRLAFRMQRILCSTWDRLHNDVPASPQGEAAYERMTRNLDCPAP